MDGRIIDRTGRSISVTVNTRNFLVQEKESQRQMKEILERLRAKGAKVSPTGDIILDVDSGYEETR